MTPDTLTLLQAQRPTWLVWIGAGLALLTGLVLLIYFISRVKRSEKQADEEWDRTGGLLDVDKGAGSSVERTERPSGERLKETRPTPAPTFETPPISPVPPQSFAAEPPPPVDLDRAPHRDSPLPVVEEVHGEMTAVDESSDIPTPPFESLRAVEEVHGDLTVDESSDIPAPPFEPELPDAAALDDEVWAELDAGDVAGRPEVPAAEAVVPPPRAAVERFEPPTVEARAPRRERYEPPTIMPIVPRQGAAPERARKPVTAPRVPVQQASRAAVTGSTLGLPAEPARGPLTLQNASARVRGAQGINTLSNYGQPPEDETKSHAGTITLIITVVLVGAAVLAYLYVPRFHAWVDNLKLRARGVSTEPVSTSNQPKVKVLPQRPTVDKNQVKAWGYVFNNTTDEVLTAISVELGLMKPDGSTEPVVVPVKPDEIQPGPPSYSNRPVFEYSYDGKKYTGYKLLRVLSNGAEVPYVAASQGP